MIQPFNHVIFVIALCTTLLLSGSNASAKSLYNEQNYQTLASDNRVVNVGDQLTILIFESAKASTSANTGTDKSLGLGAGINYNHSEYGGNQMFANADASHRFNGGGQVNRSGEVVANVTVMVVDKSPNGYLVIEGKQLINLNEEQQEISISGQVRPADISTNNTVLSTRIANASINFIGDGLLGNQQKPGVITRFVNWVF